MRLNQFVLLVAVALATSSLHPIELVACDGSEASADQVSASASDSQTAKSPRLIKRIIRVRDSSPAPDGQAPAGGATPPSNGGINNTVDVKPEISVQVPNAQGGPQVSELPQNMRSSNKKVNKVPYKRRQRPPTAPQPSAANQVEPIVEEPMESEPHVGSQQDDGIEPGSNEQQLQIIPNTPPIGQAANAGGRSINLLGHSGNQRNTLLNNVGNTETVQIDGVGNKKVTKISNSGNADDEQVDGAPKSGDRKPHRHHKHCKHDHKRPPRGEGPPTMVKSSGLATGGAPLVQINIKEQAGAKDERGLRGQVVPPPSFLVPVLSDSALVDVRSGRLGRPDADLLNPKVDSKQSNGPGQTLPVMSMGGQQYVLVQQQPFGANPMPMPPVYQLPGAQQMMMMPPPPPMLPMPPMPPMWPMWPMWSPMGPYPMEPPGGFFHEERPPRRRRRHQHKKNKKNKRDKKEKKRDNKPEQPEAPTTPAPEKADPLGVPDKDPKPAPSVAKGRLEQLKSWLPEMPRGPLPGMLAYEGKPKEEEPKEEIEWETIRVPKVKKPE